MKKVLFLIGSLQGGGAEKVLIDTVNCLDPEKYEITIQTLFDDGVHKERLSDKVRYKTIVKTKFALIKKVIGKLLFFYLPSNAVYNFFIKDSYDYEIAFLEGLPTKLISRSTERNSKKIAWVHTDLKDNPDSYRAFGSPQKEQAAYECFDKVLCVSKAVEAAFVDKYAPKKPKVGTLYNILDDEAIIAASKENVILPTELKPCLISVGRLTQQKGYDRLLRIHKRLMEEGLTHSLLIIGEGELRAEFEKYIEENDLSRSVFLLGFQKNPYKYISKADAFVCSSYAEGFSTVITEAVLCGTPVIATDVAGNREPEEAPRCSVLASNNETTLYEALQDIVMNPEILKKYKQELNETQTFWRKKKLLDTFEKYVF